MCIRDRYLENAGYETLSATNGEEGLTEFREKRPDLVLLDIAMAPMNGLEVLRRLKEIDKEAGVIMITAFRDAEKVVTAFRAGAYDCLFKPFDYDYLIKTIRDKVQ